MYDFENRLILRTKSDGSSINIAYDADGNRIQKTILSAAAQIVSTSTYLVDTNNLTGYAQVVEEIATTPSSSTTKTFSYGSGLISVARTVDAQPTVVNYFLYDGLGSIRALTDANGAITDTYTYDAFGSLISTTGTSANVYRYRGEQWDSDLGLYYNRARYLNTDSGRFWNADSYEGVRSDPASLHKYLFANANPATYFDPSGFLFIANFYYGNLVHRLIGEDFNSRGFGLWDVRIDTLIGPNLFGASRPDLATPATIVSPGEIYEIKSVITGPIAASAQLGFYLIVLNSTDPQKRAWLPGTSYDPPAVLSLGNGAIALVRRAAPGVILYEVIDAKELSLMAAGAALAAISEIETDVAMGCMLALMGG